MKSLDNYRAAMVVAEIVALILAVGRSANADFVFGELTNVGVPINSLSNEWSPHVSEDGLTLFFSSNRPGGYGSADIWVATRDAKGDPWNEPVNLGSAINGSSRDSSACLAASGLELYFTSDRPGGYGDRDIWVATRDTTSDAWHLPVNLGPTVNSGAFDGRMSLTADGLSLFFVSTRPGGLGNRDIWVATRTTIDSPWDPPVNCGPNVNSAAEDHVPAISPDGRMLVFTSDRPDEFGGRDMYLTTRVSTADDWSAPTNLGPTLNSSVLEGSPDISPDGRMLYFNSTRQGGVGGNDIWQVPIDPVVDFNDDRTVDSADIDIMIDFWGTDEPLCDIGPMPWGDGVVDVQDLIVLAEHLFEEIPPTQ